MMTSYFIIVFVLSNITLILPWDYKSKITKIIPYADKRIGIVADKGAYCREKGMLRFKLQNEPFPISKPNAGDQYENGEIIVMALSKTKMFYARRVIDRAKKKILISVGDQVVSDVNHFERMLINVPDWIKMSMEKNLILMIMYCTITMFVMTSNALVLLPMIWKSIFGCG